MTFEAFNPSFDPVLFIKPGKEEALRRSVEFPFLHNFDGHGVQLPRREGVLIEIAHENPDLDLGFKYKDIGRQHKEIPDKLNPYWITLFDFRVNEIHYESLQATRQSVQAFGMTLLKSGECVKFPYDGLVMAQYSYGKWAAHQSPYLGASRRRELLTTNPTDLEYHNFPHVFFSQDALPLVVSVARWRPYVNEIALADLWVDPGDALVLPPKVMPGPPRSGSSPEEDRRKIVDLHGNRNSALACWFKESKAKLDTTTILANSNVMSTDEARIYYHEEPGCTKHHRLK